MSFLFQSNLRSKVLAWVNLWLKIILRCLWACNKRVAEGFYPLCELMLEFKAQRTTRNVEKYKNESLEMAPPLRPK